MPQHQLQQYANLGVHSAQTVPQPQSSLGLRFKSTPNPQQQQQQQQQQQHSITQSNALLPQNMWIHQQQHQNHHTPMVLTMSQNQQSLTEVTPQQQVSGYPTTFPLVGQQQQQQQQQLQQQVFPQEIASSQNFAPSTLKVSPPMVQRPDSQFTLTQPSFTGSPGDNPVNIMSGSGGQNILLNSIASSTPSKIPIDYQDTFLPTNHKPQVHHQEDVSLLVNTIMKLLGSIPQVAEASQNIASVSRTDDTRGASANATILKVASDIRLAVARSGLQSDRESQGTPRATETILIPPDSPSTQSVRISQQELEQLSLIIVSVLKLQYPSVTSLPAPADVARAISISPSLLSPLLALQATGNSRSRSVRSAFDSNLGYEAGRGVSTLSLPSPNNSTTSASSLLSLLLAPFASSVSSPSTQRNKPPTVTKTVKQELQQQKLQEQQRKQQPIVMNLSDVNIDVQGSSRNVQSGRMYVLVVVS